MNQLLRIGMTVQTDASAKPCAVEQFLGSGGQGEVYRANLDGQALALKWYFPHQETVKIFPPHVFCANLDWYW